MSLALFLYTGEDDRFDADIVRAILDDIPGASDFKVEDDTARPAAATKREEVV